MEHDENEVTPRSELCRSVFELGFRAWSGHSQRGSWETRQIILHGLRAVDNTFPGHPAIPSGLNLAKSPGCWEATGTSFWDAGGGSSSSDSPSSSCAPGTPEMEPQKHSFPITKSQPTRLTLRDSTESEIFSLLGDKDDHVTILVLAWAYVLSARWAELIPGANDTSYTDVGEKSSNDTSSIIEVPIVATSGDAARWWQAVLSPGQGWLATADTDGKSLYSPWSVRLSSRPALKPLFLGNTPTLSAAPDTTTALEYLSKYVAMYGVVDQSRAALSAVLCLPFASHWGHKITLPAPSISVQLPESQKDKTLPLGSMAQVDKLLALSCNARGIEALLLSTFFDPAVPCNLVSPFLQGSFAALDTISEDPLNLIHTLLQHSPKVGFLWVGALVLGKHTPLLEQARHGISEIELLSAVWTGTIQTFMQLPVCTSQSGRIRREDECRLAYLTSKDYQRNIPFHPWKPFGSVEVKDAELGVQIHAGCRGHVLRYKGWAWDCWENGRPVSVMHHPPAPDGDHEQPISLPRTSVEVPYDKLDLGNDSASCTATLNIFIWLRRRGFAVSERHIRRHEWLCEPFDDEEEEAYESWPEYDDDSVYAERKRPKSEVRTSKLGGWLASTQARREQSV